MAVMPKQLSLNKQLLYLCLSGSRLFQFSFFVDVFSLLRLLDLQQWFSTWGLRPTGGAWQKFGGAWRLKTF